MKNITLKVNFKISVVNKWFYNLFSKPILMVNGTEHELNWRGGEIEAPEGIVSVAIKPFFKAPFRSLNKLINPLVGDYSIHEGNSLLFVKSYSNNSPFTIRVV